MNFGEELLVKIVSRVLAVLLVSLVVYGFRALGRALKRGSRKEPEHSIQQVDLPPVPPPPPPVNPAESDATVVQSPAASESDTVYQPQPLQQPEPPKPPLQNSDSDTIYQPQPLQQPEPQYQPQPLRQPEPQYRPQPQYPPQPQYRPQPQPQYPPQPQYRPQPDYRQGTVALESSGEPYYGAVRQNPKRYNLLALSGSLKGRRFPLNAMEICIGRSSSCQIQFPANTPGVSGKHCKVNLTPGGMITVTDVGSTYGTYLGDGRRLYPNNPAPLTPGNTFLLAGLDGPAFLLEEQ